MSILLSFYKMLWQLGKIGPNRTKTILKNSAENKRKLSGTAYEGFIEDQNRYSFLQYGVKTFAYNGCGIAAVYNALLAMGHVDGIGKLPDIIERFEKKGSVCFGRFGTWPPAAEELLQSLGFSFSSTRNPAEMERLAKESEILLFTFLNDRKNPLKQMHTICITKDKGRFLAHNSHSRLEAYKDFESLVRYVGAGDGKAGGLYLIGIRV